MIFNRFFILLLLVGFASAGMRKVLDIKSSQERSKLRETTELRKEKNTVSKSMDDGATVVDETEYHDNDTSPNTAGGIKSDQEYSRYGRQYSAGPIPIGLLPQAGYELGPFGPFPNYASYFESIDISTIVLTTFIVGGISLYAVMAILSAKEMFFPESTQARNLDTSGIQMNEALITEITDAVYNAIKNSDLL